MSTLKKKPKKTKHTKNSYYSTSKTKQNKNKKQPDNKNGQRTWIDIFSKRIYRWPTHEKMLNITNHQENAPQNHNEIPPHTCQNGYHQKDNK